MNAIFDTLAYARRMESVGFTRAQAEAMAEEQARLIDERLATKADIAAVKADIAAVKADIAAVQAKTDEVRAALAHDIERVRLESQAKTDEVRAALAHDIERLRLEGQTSIERLRVDGQAGNEQLRANMKTSDELMRREMTIRLGSIVIATVAVGSAVVTVLSRLHP